MEAEDIADRFFDEWQEAKEAARDNARTPAENTARVAAEKASDAAYDEVVATCPRAGCDLVEACAALAAIAALA